MSAHYTNPPAKTFSDQVLSAVTHFGRLAAVAGMLFAGSVAGRLATSGAYAQEESRLKKLEGESLEEAVHLKEENEHIQEQLDEYRQREGIPLGSALEHGAKEMLHTFNEDFYTATEKLAETLPYASKIMKAIDPARGQMYDVLGAAADPLEHAAAEAARHSRNNRIEAAQGVSEAQEALRLSRMQNRNQKQIDNLTGRQEAGHCEDALEGIRLGAITHGAAVGKVYEDLERICNDLDNAARENENRLDEQRAIQRESTYRPGNLQGYDLDPAFQTQEPSSYPACHDFPEDQLQRANYEKDAPKIEIPPVQLEPLPTYEPPKGSGSGSESGHEPGDFPFERFHDPGDKRNWGDFPDPSTKTSAFG